MSGNLAAAGGVRYAGSDDGAIITAFEMDACWGGGWDCPPLATVTVDGAPDRLVVAAGHLFVGVPAGSGSGDTAVFAPTG